ncbi:MAG TPA: hypothetical protein VK184_07145 [Nostocaceae cyanobacterium]|nr:hypothetical protein [Nostocaceae cyanobacterium]
MDSSQIANLLRAVADIIESDPKFAKAIEKHLAENLQSENNQDSSEVKSKKSNNKNTLENGDAVLTECRSILREKGEEQLKVYLTELGEKIRDLLKYGQLDPHRSIRRKKDLNIIIDHVIEKLKAQDKNGKLFAASINKNLS